MSDTPDPQAVREIAREYILNQAKYWNAAEIRQQYRTDPRCARLADEGFVDLRDAVINAVAAAIVTVSWPDEQPQDERDALAEVTAELDAANDDADAIADQRTAYREEIMRLRARVRELEAAQDERDGDVRADAFELDCEELVEIFAEFIGEWDRSHEVITVGLPDHLPQLRIPHLRRAVVALQRLGRERNAALEARDDDVRAVARAVGILDSVLDHGYAQDAIDVRALLLERFQGAIAELDAREAKANER